MNSEHSIPSNWLKSFVPIWTAQAFSLLGSGLVQFALVWWLTQKTGSATVLATATMVALLPEVLLGPFAGALVDRWNRKTVMMLADGSTAVITAFLGFLYWAGAVQVWHIYIIIFLRALGGAFQWPAMQSSISLMVPDEHLARVAGINQSLRGALNIATPPLGALLLTLIPFYGIVSIDVATAAIAVSMLFFIRIPQPVKNIALEKISPAALLRDVRGGLRYINAWPGFMALLGVATVLNFVFYPVSALMPLLVTKHFLGNAWHLSALDSVWGIGIVSGGLLLGAWGGFRRKIITCLFGLILQGIGLMLVAAAPPNLFVLALVGMGIAGTMNAMVNGPLFALVQSRVAPEMQGRVFTLIASIAGAMGPISMLMAGPLADRLGIHIWYWLSAIITMLMGAGCFLVPSIMHLEDNQGPQLEPGTLPALVSTETGD